MKWTETCPLWWTRISYSTFVNCYTQKKERIEKEKTFMAVNSGKMSTSYSTVNKGVLLSLMAKMLFLLFLELTYFIELIFFYEKMLTPEDIWKGATRMQLSNLSILRSCYEALGLLIIALESGTSGFPSHIFYLPALWSLVN